MMVTMADILNLYGQPYIDKFENDLLPSHKRTIHDICNCRTKALGGQVYKCPDHLQYEYKFHSCYNRHCPLCQNEQATQWLANERKRLINLPYFLITFTLPQQLRHMARSNQKLFYNLMFSQAWRTLQKLANNPKWLGGSIGALAILHTWTKTMLLHPHIHFLIPAIAVDKKNSTYIKANKKFFLPVKGLSKVFRAMMRDALKKQAPLLFQLIPARVWKRAWVVNSKPLKNGMAVLKYFAPYVFRVAISNKRILKLENGKVTFKYKDKNKKWKTMTLPVFEFIRRFLQHILPKGFKKVRHYGFIASRNKQLLAKLQYRFGTVEIDHSEQQEQQAYSPICAICNKPMILIDIVKPGGFEEKRILKALARSP